MNNFQMMCKGSYLTVYWLINSYRFNDQMNNFQMICKVGEGAFASVFKAKRKQDSLIYAMKKIKISTGNSKEILNSLNEVRILASISNPYILSYKEAFYDEPSQCMCLITEFAEGGDLSNFIQNQRKKKQYVEEMVIWNMCIQMLHGLKALHRMNIFHRDIKSANILLTHNQAVKLADMNVSKISKSGLATTQTGTPYYASPEVWSDMPYNGKCDIWSLGCVLYELASFRPPFMANDIPSLKKKINAGHYQRIPQFYSQELEDLIRLCLTVNPRERPTAQGMLGKSLIRKKLYHFPNQKFNEIAYQDTLNKENKLLQTIKVPHKYCFGSELKNKLPKSNYGNNFMKLEANKSERIERHRSTEQISMKNDVKLPEIGKKYRVKEKLSIPKPALLYLRA